MFEAVQTLAGYWERRAQKFAGQSDGLAAVCSFGMPRFYNRSIEMCQRRALRKSLGDMRNGDVLEIGCGIGRWTAEMASNGCRVYGIDLSPTMIDEARRRLQARGLDAELQVANASDFLTDRQFDSALSVTVLQHIMDDTEFNRAISNIACQLKPGACFTMLEAAPSGEVSRCDSPIFRARTLRGYTDALEKNGFTVETVSGVDPVPFKTWVLPHLNSMPRPLAIAAIALATAVSLPLDLILSRYMVDSSWHKVIVARRSD